MSSHLSKLLMLVLIFSVVACQSTTKTTGGDREATTIHSRDKENKVGGINQTTNSPTTQLVDLIRRLPGVNIQGSHPNVIVSVRGITSTSGAISVLYVLDNIPMGNDYARVTEGLDMTRVKRVSVLKGAEAAIYGNRGSGGVIIIRMKLIRED